MRFVFPLLMAANAAPEWQAKTQVLKQETGGGLSTQGACYTAHYKTPIAYFRLKQSSHTGHSLGSGRFLHWFCR